VNDAHGHRVGDLVLREVSARLGACVRKADTLARQGGDEFVVVIPDLPPEADGQVVAEKILRALAAPLHAEGAALRLGASIGISLSPADAGDGDALLRNADAAMYRAKRAGGNQVCHYGRSRAAVEWRAWVRSRAWRAFSPRTAGASPRRLWRWWRRQAACWRWGRA
jgi:diguanylate cyclase (GGDEF)-like protein